MRIGLFGFPMTGKSTLFRLLTGAETPLTGARRETQVGITRVPEPRLDRLAAMYSPKKVTPATVEYLDLAAVEKGQAVDTLPLDQLRTVDALAHVVRDFCNEAVPHVDGDIDPARDAATMETELIMADHTIAERRIEKLEAMYKKMRKDEDKQQLDLMRNVVSHLEQETPLRNVEFTEQEQLQVRGFTFLSLKPLLIVVNADEADASRLDKGAEGFGLGAFADKPVTEVVALSAKIEEEIAHLDAEDSANFRADLGIAEPALDRMIRASYRLLGRNSFFTVGEDECRAWEIAALTKAHHAGGVIHSDIQKGFIRAEVIAYEDLVSAGSWNAAKEKGTLRLEGRDYVVKDGDIAHFRFNV